MAARREGSHSAESPARGDHRAHPLPAVLREPRPPQARKGHARRRDREERRPHRPALRTAARTTSSAPSPASCATGRRIPPSRSSIAPPSSSRKTSTTSIRSSPAIRRPRASPFRCRKQAELVPALDHPQHASIRCPLKPFRADFTRTRRRPRRSHAELHRDPAANPPAPRQGTHAAGPRRAEKRTRRKRRAGPHRVHQTGPHARRPPRPGRDQGLAAAGHRALARGRPRRPADGLSVLRPGRHRQDLHGRVPRRRSGRARRENEKLPRQMGRQHREQSGENLPPARRARPLHRLRGRGGPGARPPQCGLRATPAFPAASMA